MKLSVVISFSLLGCILISGGRCREEHSDTKVKSCIDRAQFIDQKSSEFVLPFPENKKYVLSQSYCFQNGGHRNQLAYDFALPIGALITASRAGVVVEVRQDLEDTGTGVNPGDHNHVFIQHSDGSVAFYAHIKQNGSLVNVGDSVAQGQSIAESGQFREYDEFSTSSFCSL